MITINDVSRAELAAQDGVRGPGEQAAAGGRAAEWARPADVTRKDTVRLIRAYTLLRRNLYAAPSHYDSSASHTGEQAAAGGQSRMQHQVICGRRPDPFLTLTCCGHSPGHGKGVRRRERILVYVLEYTSLQLDTEDSRQHRVTMCITRGADGHRRVPHTDLLRSLAGTRWDNLVCSTGSLCLPPLSMEVYPTPRSLATRVIVLQKVHAPQKKRASPCIPAPTKIHSVLHTEDHQSLE
jgi:hypothetical protein